MYDDFAKLQDRVQLATPTSAARKPIPEAVRHAVWRRDAGKCVACGSQENLEFDHIIPFSRGGADTALGVPSGAKIPCRRKPQKKREWLLQ